MITEDDTLLKESLSLSAAGDATTPLALIHNLPPEILSYIFILSKIHCGHDVDSSAPLRQNRFSEVSLYWRRIMVNTPALWTHIDISVGGYKSHHYEYALLCLARSGDLPIHIHIYELEDDYDNFMSDSEIHRLMTLLAPHLSRMSTLDIESESSSPRLVDSVLDFWTSNGVSGLTKTLSVSRQLISTTATPNQMLMSAHQAKTPERSEDVLLHLPTLKLFNTIFHWDSTAYHGLTELQLDSTALYPLYVPISKLAAVLACSPGLVTLRLSNLIIYTSDSGDWDTSTVVKLESLEVLDVINLKRQSLPLLLPLLSLPNRAAKLSVGTTLSNHVDINEGIQTFLMRYPITTLFLASMGVWDSPQHRLLDLFSRLPNLERLALHQYGLTGHSPPKHSSNRDLPIEPESSQRQSPCEIYLIRCTFNMQTLRWLIDLGRVRVLHLERCELFVEGDDHQGPRTMENVKKLLDGMYPDLECIISQQDTTTQWPCRMLFKY